MRTIRTKLYKFGELSKEAKTVAIDRYLQNEDFDWVHSEAFNTCKKFAEIFSIKIDTIDFLETYRSKYQFELEDNILELSGQRLATYIWNNFRTDLYKGKFFSLWSKTEKSYKHYKDGFPVLKSRHSRIILSTDCVLTGFYYDDVILQPIYDHLTKPGNCDFKDLLEDCISELCNAVENEIIGNSQPGAVEEHFEANGYEFLKDGQRY